MRKRVKKSLSKLIGLVLILAITTHCKKINEGTELFLYTAAVHEGSLKLYINQKAKGELPLLITTLSANNDSIRCKALHLKLKRGEYNFEVRGDDGEVKFSGVFKIQRNFYETTSTVGQLDNAVADGVLVSRLSFN